MPDQAQENTQALARAGRDAQGNRITGGAGQAQVGNPASVFKLQFEMASAFYDGKIPNYGDPTYDTFTSDFERWKKLTPEARAAHVAKAASAKAPQPATSPTPEATPPPVAPPTGGAPPPVTPPGGPGASGRSFLEGLGLA